MAKLIYSLKIYLYRSQFVLSASELGGLKRFILFVLTIYLKNWYEAPCAMKAAQNDLKLIRDISRFKSVDESISESTLKTFSRHLWYLSEDLAGMALFDETLHDSEKRLMVDALKKPECLNPSVKAKVTVESIMNYRISDFVTSNRLTLFRALNVSHEFLKTPVESWPNQADYVAARKIVRKLKVVNDIAERAIGTATVFNDEMSTDESRWQEKLRVVEQQRTICPNSNKQTILKVVNDKSC